ncbi:MAG: YgaP family membrane protein [Bacteroidia bacterium]
MKRNIGTSDRLLRILAGFLIAGANYTGVLSGTLGTISLVVAVILFLTSLVNFCPLYTLFGVNTCKTK